MTAPSTAPRPSSTSPATSSGRVAVDGTPSLGLRILGMALPAVVLIVLAWGLGAALLHAQPRRPFLIAALISMQIAGSAALILLGSLVEGFGWGLSLGTDWPYTRNIALRMWRGDPEAAHRLLATALGLGAVALVILQPGAMSWTGLGLIVATALFGMGTLYVLAGRAPALVHGIHGLLAYGVFITYLAGRLQPAFDLGRFLQHTIVLHSVLFAIFMGGMVTGQRGFGRAIESFVRPRRASQWVFVVHGFAALLVIGTLGWLSPIYPVAFALAVLQAAIGFFQFQSVQLRPRSPGVIVAIHQSLALLITAAVILRWGI